MRVKGAVRPTAMASAWPGAPRSPTSEATPRKKPTLTAASDHVSAAVTPGRPVAWSRGRQRLLTERAAARTAKTTMTGAAPFHLSPSNRKNRSLTAAGAAAVSDLFFRLLGDKWNGAAPVMVVFAVLAAARSVNNLCLPLLQATGRPGVTAALTWSLAAVNVGFFLGVASLVGDRGAPGQALAMAVGRTAPFTLIYLPITLALAIRMAKSSWRGILVALRPALLSVPAIVVGARGAVALLDPYLGDFGMLLMAVAVGGLAGGSVLVTTSPFWRSLLIKAILVIRRNPPTAGT